MLAPTLYYLFFKRNNCDEYDVFESHTCQEKGCIMTSEQYLTTCLPGEIESFVKEFQSNLIEGVVDGFKVEEWIEED